jgi:AcrR family transcriptional regulator
MTAVTARQLEIIAVARALLERDGIEALTVGRLAAELGIKPPSLYKHFAGKRELEAHLIADGLREHAEALEASSGSLPAIAPAYRAFALANPQLYRLMTERPLPRAELPAGLEARAAAPLVAAVGGDGDVARAVWAFAHGMVQLELVGRFPADADLDAAWAKALSAFAAATR